MSDQDKASGASSLFHQGRPGAQEGHQGRVNQADGHRQHPPVSVIVFQACERRDAYLASHWDHAGGNEELVSRTKPSSRLGPVDRV